jgi:ArsR family metal-binding transcriptional regulator
MKLIIVFPLEAELEKALAILNAAGHPCVVVPPVPALVTETAGLAAILEAGPRITIAGWAEYRPASCGAPVPKEFPEDIFGKAAIVFFGPCMADEAKVRLVAHLSGDVTKVLPYLNAEMPGACYCADGPNLTFMKGYRLVTLSSRRIAIGKADEITDAWRLLAEIRDRINETWARRASITPSFEMRSKPPVLEIYKRLPRTNCRLCGEPSCMAFAAKLRLGEGKLSQCSPVFEGDYRHLKPALVEVCAPLGVGG